jgi:NAD/NADP transhydrogenase beta subunit
MSGPRAGTFNYTLIALGTVIGLIIGAIGAYSVKMTAMPQMVAMFNGLGGGAAALVASLEFLRRAQGSGRRRGGHNDSHVVRHAHRFALVFRQHHCVPEAGGKI